MIKRNIYENDDEKSRKGEGNMDNMEFDLMAKKLYSAVISDVLDDLGYTYKNRVMQANIRPLYPNAVVVGKAVPVIAVDIYEIRDNPYKGEIEYVDSLKKDDVVVASTRGSDRYGFWGELLSTAAQVRGARGAVIDGYTRDVKKILELKFPVFTLGIKPLDSKGRSWIYDYNCPAECGGVLVYPGDIVFGDIDGVVVIPKEVAKETITEAFKKVQKENLTRKMLQEGAYLRDAYKKYGVL
jgi:regulator of RNase E activity RraA